MGSARSRSTRRWAAGAAGTLLAGLCVACGSGSSTSASTVTTTATAGSTATPSATTSGEPVVRSIDETLKSSARVRLSSDVTSKGQTYTLTMVGAYDFGRQSGRLDVTVRGAGSSVSEVFTEDTIYAKLPPSEGSAGGWASLARSGATAHYLLRTPANDPGDLLRQARRVSWDGDGVADDVGGRQATKYVGTMDDDTAVLYLSDEAKAKARQVFQAAESVSDGVVASAWVDDAGRLVRLALDWKVADPATNGSRSTLTLDLTEPGVPVSVKVPATATSVGDFGGILLG